MRRGFIIIVANIIFLNVACHKDDLVVNPPPESSGIIPLAVNNEWFYNLTAYDTLGNAIKSVTVPFNITGDSVANGTRWYKISTNLSNFKCTNLANGLFSSDGNLALKYPTFVQDSFYVNGTVGYLSVTTIDTLITISIGSYHCYGYKNIQLHSPGMAGGSHDIVYICPTIGPIKYESYLSTRTGTKQYLRATAELLSVTLQ
jgi:hypothetical protein